MAEEKTAEELKDQEKNLERFMFLVDGCNDGIWDWDINTGEFYFSRRWLEMVGYKEGELKECFNTIIDLIHPDDLGEMLDIWTDYMEGVVSCYNLEYRLKLKEGGFLWVESRGISARDEEGEPYRFSGFHTDITQRKEQERLLAEKTTQLNQKTNDIANMLQNMKQGVFTIVEGGLIHPEYSAFLEELIGESDIANKNMIDLVFDNTDVGSDTIDQMKAALFAILGEDEFSYDVNGHILIHEFQKLVGDKSKIIQLDWVPILTDDDIVEKILIIAQDVTELRQLAIEAEKQKEELNIIGQILNISQEKFNGFTESAFDYIAENKTIIEKTTEKDPDSLSALFRNMHTIKGNARTYEFTGLTNTIHEVEQTYDNLRKDPDSVWNAELLLKELEMANCAIKHYNDINSNKLGRKGRAGDLLTSRGTFIPNGILDDTVQISQYATAKYPDDEKLKALHNNIRKVGKIPLERLASGAMDSVHSLAGELNKPVPDFKLNDLNAHFHHNLAEPLKSSFMHIVRNSLDHGIESEEERVNQGKAGKGTIVFEVKDINNSAEIHIHDDGRGLALHKIHEKAVKNEILSADDKPTAQQVANLIFHSGLSTAEAVTQVSGRGVGMDAVKSFMTKVGANVEIKLLSDSNEITFSPFEFIITIPSNNYFI
ncbi:MAG: PAS domain-containing protein [Methylococcales bacterium]|nr:PAS domain-containing protein [Methylococcales bacterium]